MRRTIMSLFILFIAFSLSAQIKMDLKGPAAKNYKSWKEEKVQRKASNHTSTITDHPQGPAAKNYKPWKNISPADVKRHEVNTKLPIIRKGPKAKNFKPWKRQELIRQNSEQ